MLGHRHGERMEEVAVKQGPLYLLQQQTFGKVRARLGWDWVEGLGGLLLEIPEDEREALNVPKPVWEGGDCATPHVRPLAATGFPKQAPS